MNFELSPEDRELVDLIDKVARQFTKVGLGPHDGDPRPLENMRMLGELGIIGVCMPASVGGLGRPGLSGILAIEHIARHCPRTGSAALMAIAGPGMFIAKWGNERQKEKYLPGLIRGEKAFSISLTEPQAGTALTDIRTNARIDGDKVILNGHKIFCSHADQNDHILLFCRFSEGTKGIGAVIVDTNMPGLSLGKPHKHMSGVHWSELYFENAVIPRENILFDGNGFTHLMASYSLERAAAGAYVLGVAQSAFEMAKSYAIEREQFGRPIADFQMIQARLADMYMRLEQARLLLYKATATADGTAGRLASSAAKIATTEAANYVTDAAMQIHGGAGMSQDLPLEWFYRVVRPYSVAGGTSDIHRSMIASELLNRRFDHRLPDGAN